MTTPQTIIHKLLKIHRFVSVDRIRAHVLFKSGEDISPRVIKKIIRKMRSTEELYIGTSYKKGEGFYLIKTAKQHQKNLEFWDKKIKSASKQKELAKRAFKRITAKLIKTSPRKS